MRILLAEDEPAMAEAIVAFLQYAEPPGIRRASCGRRHAAGCL